MRDENSKKTDVDVLDDLNCDKRWKKLITERVPRERQVIEENDFKSEKNDFNGRRISVKIH